MTLIFVVSLLATCLRFSQGILPSLTQYPGTPKVFLYPLLWYFAMYSTHAWDRSIVRFSNEFYIRVLKAGWQSLLLFAAIAYLTKYPISRIWVALNALLITIALLIARYLIRFLYFRRIETNEILTYLYIGKKEDLEHAKVDFSAVYGFLPRFIHHRTPRDGEIQTWISDYSSSVVKNHAYGVLIGVGAIQDAALLRQLADTNRQQVIDFVLATKLGGISDRFEKLESPILVRVRESSLIVSGSVPKRVFDIAFSVTSLLILTPLLILIAIMVKLSSKGPVLYIDKRVGRNGKLFTFPKFRSMYQGADKERLAVLGRPDESMVERYRSDPRITPLGRFMRRWSIDELPQLWCVLVGSMSIVGPRPVLQEELVQIPSRYEVRFLAKPGLTGLWQVTGRKEVPWEDRMLRDISYIDSWSLFTDLVLVFKTVGAIIKGQGAH